MKFKHIPQHDQTDCGAACLAMIAKHYKKDISIGRIRECATTDRLGTNFVGMTNAAEELGFLTKSVMLEGKSIDRNLPQPFIAHMKIGTMYHFVVVYKISQKTIYIADPAVGKKKISKDEFLDLFTGAAMVLVPAPNFKRGKKTSTPLGRFFPLLSQFKLQFVEVFIASIMLFFFNIAHFFYIRFIIDDIIPGGMKIGLNVISIGMLVVIVLRVGLNAIREYILAHIGNRIDLSIVFSYFYHIVNLPLSFFDRRKTGEILNRLEDASRIREVISGVTLSIFMDTLMVFGVGFFLFKQSPLLMGVTMVTLPFSILTVLLFHKPFRNNNVKSMSYHAESNAHMVETMNSIFTVKAMNNEKISFWKGEFKILKAMKQNFRLEYLDISQGSLISFFDSIGNVLIFWVGAILILDNTLTLGQLISFQALLGYFIGPIRRFLTLQPTLQGASVAAERILSVLDLKLEDEKVEKFIPIKDIKGAITFNQVDFRYGSRRMVLKKVNLNIAVGEKVALVGSSGSGKSSLIKLLLKFYKPVSGNILIDDHHIEDIETSFLRSKIGYVPQDVILFSGTIIDNIRMHCPNASYEQVIEACKKANCLNIIEDLPDRFNTVVSERGGSLSGGEKQRVAIARALLGEPRILVFDEATSALDSITERTIKESLDNLSENGISTIMIAHRLSTVISCDKIIVLNRGEIVETGSHNALLTDANSFYSKLWSEQRSVCV